MGYDVTISVATFTSCRRRARRRGCISIRMCARTRLRCSDLSERQEKRLFEKLLDDLRHWAEAGDYGAERD